MGIPGIPAKMAICRGKQPVPYGALYFSDSTVEAPVILVRNQCWIACSMSVMVNIALMIDGDNIEPNDKRSTRLGSVAIANLDTTFRRMIQTCANMF